MKKIFTALLVASMMLTGCGNNTANDAKQKVEQKAEEVKQDAAQKVEETAAKVEEKAAEVKEDAAQVAKDAQNAANQKFTASREVPLAGILPGVALDKVIQALGEPSTRDGDEMTFSNGVEVELKDDNNTVEKVTVRNADISTPEGVAVGMSEYVLNDKYGAADKVDVDDGEVDYKYYSTDKSKVLEFTSSGGTIIKIETKFND